MIDDYSIRDAQQDDLENLRTWRNHPEIRRHMRTQHEILKEEHESWFAATSKDPTHRLMIVEEGASAIGCVQFSEIAEGGAANWGFYTRPGSAKGRGTILGNIALHFAFDALELHKVRGQALSTNAASIALHRKLGFEQEGFLKEEYYIRGRWRDLVYFGLLKRSWRSMGQ